MPQQPDTSFDNDLQAVRESFEADLSSVRQPAPHGEQDFSRAAASRIGQNLNPMPILRGLKGILTHRQGPQAGLGEAVYGVGKSILSPLGNAPDAFREARQGNFGRAALTAAESIPLTGPIISRGEESYQDGGLPAAAGSIVGDLATIPLTSAIGVGMKGLARMGAKPILGTTSSQVAKAALANRAMPGLIRSGDTRAGIRLRNVESQASRVLEGPAGDAQIRAQELRAGPATAAEWARIKKPRDNKAASLEATALQRAAPTEGLIEPTARNVFNRAQESRSSGPTGMAAAIDADQMSAVGRAVPQVAPMMSRANDIQAVRDTYRRAPQAPLSTGGLPNMKARLVVGTINKLAGPTTQGLYNTGSALTSDAVRAAMLALLAEHEEDPQRPMPSHGAR